jgi:Uncharacterised protein family (UPF0014).
MWLQLLTIGYCLTFLFNTKTPWVIVFVLLVMVVAASWISLNEVQQQRRELFFKALAAISLGGGITLAIINLWGITIITLVSTTIHNSSVRNDFR